MKKFPLYLILISLLSACGNKSAFTLKGNISGLASDTILVFYQLPKQRLDTIIAEKGKFTYTIVPDTFTLFSLIVDDEQTLPIYADKGQDATLSGTTEQLQIKGTGENERQAQIFQHINNTGNGRQGLLAAVDSFIKANPHSYTNIYLIDKYYVQDTLPDYKKIDELVKGLGGAIKDTPYMVDLQNKLDEKTKTLENRSVSTISCTDPKGKTISWNNVKDRYILLNFWASWNKESVMAQDSLATIQKALKKEKFAIISLSLDLDRKEWLSAISHRDSIQWKQVCDFRGWDNSIVKQQNINKLPANLLLSPDKRIIAKDIYGKELIDRVKELIKQDKEKEKAAKEAERARKRQNKK